MIDIIEKIIDDNKELLKKDKLEKIDVGFTNTIYSLNDKYIIKICSDISNEIDFKKEIDFYLKNENNDLIPKLYKYDTSKKIIPFYYEILEKLNGSSLYMLWHTFSQEKRELIISKICEIMKSFHKIKGNNIDWLKYIKNLYIENINSIKKDNIFTKEELIDLEDAYNEFDKYLGIEDTVLIHNDIHFDNIFYNNGNIKIIDFERSMYAPVDYELDIFYRMVDNPMKFANLEAEKLVKDEDYFHIKDYVKKYYYEITNIDNLDIRLAIYDIVYYLNLLKEYPNSISSKNAILKAVKKLLKNRKIC